MSDLDKVIQKDIGLTLYVYLKKLALPLVVIVLAVILDQVSKALLKYAWDAAGGVSIAVIKNFFYIDYAENFGASFSMLEGKTTLFIVLTPLALIFFIFLFIRGAKEKMFYRIALAAIIGGTVGNFLDRLINKGGFVRDFFRIHYFGLKIFGSYDFAIFNVADVALTAGIVMFAVYVIFFFKDPNDARLSRKTKGEVPHEESVEAYLARTAAPAAPESVPAALPAEE